jgi:hypothetical protein
MDRVARPAAGMGPAHDPIAVPDLHLRMVSEVATAPGFGGIERKPDRDGEENNQRADERHEAAHGEAFRILLL